MDDRAFIAASKFMLQHSKDFCTNAIPFTVNIIVLNWRQRQPFGSSIYIICHYQHLQSQKKETDCKTNKMNTHYILKWFYNGRLTNGSSRICNWLSCSEPTTAPKETIWNNKFAFSSSRDALAVAFTLISCQNLQTFTCKSAETFTNMLWRKFICLLFNHCW